MDVVLDRVVTTDLLCVVSVAECVGSPRIQLSSDAVLRTPIDVATPTYSYNAFAVLPVVQTQRKCSNGMLLC